MIRSRRRPLWLFVILIATVAAGIAVVRWRAAAFPKRFATVVEGRLYRSGSVTPEQLELLARDYGVRTVLSLLDPNAAKSVLERETAQRLGITWYNVPLPGNGASTPADREKIKALLNDRTAEPILVHCDAGVNRTGLAIGMYRLYHDGWTLEQVMREMRAFAFRDKPDHQNLREALADEAAAANHQTQMQNSSDP